EERIYSRNIDVVLLRTVSRTIYVFTLIALILIWIPAVTHVDRLPFAVALGMAAALTVASFAWIVLRMPREARQLVRRTLRAPRVAAALALATGGVAVAFGLVAFTPAADLARAISSGGTCCCIAVLEKAPKAAEPAPQQNAAAATHTAEACRAIGTSGSA